jgi:tRNA-dihydrouridine synthase
MMLEFYGLEAGLRHARKHLGWYLDRFVPSTTVEEKVQIMTSKNTNEVIAVMRGALERGANEDASRKAA